jgi:hypothetical protein
MKRNQKKNGAIDKPNMRKIKRDDQQQEQELRFGNGANSDQFQKNQINHPK